jgi:hypothetical protein
MPIVARIRTEKNVLITGIRKVTLAYGIYFSFFWIPHDCAVQGIT